MNHTWDQILNEPENLYLIVAVLKSKEYTKVGSDLFTCFFYGSTNSVGLAGPIIVFVGKIVGGSGGNAGPQAIKVRGLWITLRRGL